MNPVLITFLILMPIAAYCYYQIQNRIGEEQKLANKQKILKLVAKYPDKFVIVNGKLRVKPPVKTT